MTSVREVLWSGSPVVLISDSPEGRSEHVGEGVEDWIGEDNSHPVDHYSIGFDYERKTLDMAGRSRPVIQRDDVEIVLFHPLGRTTYTIRRHQPRQDTLFEEDPIEQSGFIDSEGNPLPYDEILVADGSPLPPGPSVFETDVERILRLHIQEAEQRLATARLRLAEADVYRDPVLRMLEEQKFRAESALLALTSLRDALEDE